MIGESKKINGDITATLFYILSTCLMLLFLLSLTACGRRADPVLVPSYDEERAEEKSSTYDEVILPIESKRTEEPVVQKPFTPAKPSDLVAIYTGKNIVLTWDGILDRRLKSYKIYRSSGNGYSLVGETVTPAFTDGRIEKNKKYYYKVTAVGTSESAPSEELAVETK